jgi:hypothetical protein
MEFEFPKYPFIWDYTDMYNLINYTSTILEEEYYDENIKFLLEKFPNYKIINSKQIINSRESCKNINIHTWYLSQKNIFETTDSVIKIITNSKYKFIDNVFCFIFDPNDIFDNSKCIQNKKYQNIVVIKKKVSLMSELISELIPLLYIHTHNVKGIFRFSPDDNNKINIRENINDGICYIVLDKIIIKFQIIIK